MVEKSWIKEIREELDIEGLGIKIYNSDRSLVLEEGKNIENFLKKEYDLKDYRVIIYLDKKLYKDIEESMADLVFKLVEEKYNNVFLLSEANKLKYFNFKIAETVPDAVLVFDNNGRVRYFNEKALEFIEVPKDEITNKPLQDFYLTKLKVVQVLKTGIPVFNKEIFVKTKEGKKRRLLKTILPILDENKKVIGALDKIKEINTATKFIDNISGYRATFDFGDIVHKSNKIAKIIDVAKASADTDITVLIQGESGTGKELFAHAIHNNSSRVGDPFVILDCSTIPSELVESELFGYAEGAFTGAKKGGKLGKFELADGGTIFLDEIGEMPIDIQAKLLRVLQSGTFTRVGGYEPMEIDIRIIAATNRNLEEEVRKNNFREDLFYRLNMLCMEIPPLRHRKEDIIELTNHFLEKAATKLNKNGITISKDVLDIFINYDWPGNVRELENAIFRAVNLCFEGEILPKHLPEKIVEKTEIVVSAEKDEIDEKSLEDMEIKHILELLDKNNGNKKKTAEMLGISRSTLYRKLKKYNVPL
ncbi:sigma-54 interaction domain-containing protein [Anaerosalibacter massiliensis]|uniref:Sigma-54-dependent Fis family transcriptional regulator n=1 Tax=Anaerosalibacter massiliensis TaxID=1347392 RepID=A0A9X2MJK9_9FIRM|nr:sigma-54-dependent Fis family transcriptional regulator [Anaerosalibacter massiliensis]MCR2044696.1 sigma-54-dependent Fis family transcriptional regulator [Anaerosalibacter massiliensis]